ncbi:hypothetical protein MSS93_06835 [Deinococcus radiodurans]|nr:hypothetical protein MSS93_06835 [Deinococcus radiodurans]
MTVRTPSPMPPASGLSAAPPQKFGASDLFGLIGDSAKAFGQDKAPGSRRRFRTTAFPASRRCCCLRWRSLAFF